MRQAAWGALVLLVVIALALWAGRRLFPRTVTVTHYAERIVTRTDTVRQLQRVPVVRVLTDTVILTRTVTIAVHDTVKAALWLIGALDPGPGGHQVSLWTIGPSAGLQARSVLEAPGPVIRLRADSGPVPRVDFGRWVTDTVHKKPWYFWPVIAGTLVGGIWLGRR